jgi:hypothetical protein
MLAVVRRFAATKAAELAPTCVLWWCEPVGKDTHNVIATTTAAFVVVCVIVFRNINNDILVVGSAVLVRIHIWLFVV